MAKSFDTSSIADMIFSTPDKRGVGRPKGRKSNASITFYLPSDLKHYAKNVAWENHLTLSQYIIKLLKEDRERYYAEGGTENGWTEE